MRIKFLSIIACFLFISLAITSCLDSDDNSVKLSNDATMYSFSINDIKTTIIEGKDTTNFTVAGGDYLFSIDQKERVVFNQDSLPVKTDVSRVLLNITDAGGPIYYKKNGKDTLWYSTDSLDFTKAISAETALEFTVYSPDLQAQRSYKVWINVHKQVPDSLMWNRIEGANFPAASVTGKQKAVVFNGRIYVFAESSSQVKVTYTAESDGKSWSSLKDLNGIVGKADYSSVTVFNDKLLIVADGQVYSSENGIDWAGNSNDISVRKFVASFSNPLVTSTRLYPQDKKLIGMGDHSFIQSSDGVKWQEVENIPSNFPKDNFVSTNEYISETNVNIERVTIAGTVTSNDTASVIWSVLSNETRFAQLSPIEYNTYCCPKLDNLSLIHYGGLLYAFGGKSADGTIKAFQSFYCSQDNGATWKSVSRNLSFPSSFVGRVDDFSYVIDNRSFIWIIWSNTGEVWKGRINRLSF